MLETTLAASSACRNALVVSDDEDPAEGAELVFRDIETSIVGNKGRDGEVGISVGGSVSDNASFSESLSDCSQKSRKHKSL